ncbi:hypothetical protein ACFYSF_39330 [Streptomyces canus]|uniref:hypothetical protein n=1 Tax=Streptomyces canus TaxID=58343 RepID=UPI0036976A7D
MFDTSNLFHVSSVLNRQSIARHGLDWTRMGAAPGIFQINNTGGPVDLWSVDGIDEELLLDNGNGFVYLPGRIPAARVRLVRSDVPPQVGF